jgi:hypothetical protein
MAYVIGAPDTDCRYSCVLPTERDALAWARWFNSTTHQPLPLRIIAVNEPVTVSAASYAFIHEGH